MKRDGSTFRMGRSRKKASQKGLKVQGQFLRLHDRNWQLVKHRVREALRFDTLTNLEIRRPETFGGIKNRVDKFSTLLWLFGKFSAERKYQMRGALSRAT